MAPGLTRPDDSILWLSAQTRAPWVSTWATRLLDHVGLSTMPDAAPEGRDMLDRQLVAGGPWG